MRFAEIDGARHEATISGQRGICPGCGAEVVAKCGRVKVNHWAHKSNVGCDPWWKNKGEWHQEWQDNFPKDWQEIWITNPDKNEKHIADIRTSDGVIIEFQHSPMSERERKKREDFYKNMIWIVHSPIPFQNNKNFICQVDRNINWNIQIKKLYFDIPSCYPIPSDWCNSSVPVFIDNIDQTDTYVHQFKKYLYCLFPVPDAKNKKVFFKADRKKFIYDVSQGKLHKNILLTSKIIKKQYEEYIKAEGRRTQSTLPKSKLEVGFKTGWNEWTYFTLPDTD